MRKEILIFGSDGALGAGVSAVLKKKINYSHIHYFSRANCGDLAIEENVKNAFAKITPSREALFFLFSTVGGYTGGKTTALTSGEELDKMLNTNYRSAFFIAKYYAELARKSAGGSILFTSAMTSLNPKEETGVYAASKSALNALVQTLAAEGKEFTFTANALAPYMIDTPANLEWFTGDTETLIKPEEVGEFVHSIFDNFKYLNGNIFKLTERLVIK